MHANERATFATVKSRCEAADLVMCTGRNSRRTTWATSCAQELPAWVDEKCSLSLQIQPNGRVAIIDPNSTVAMFRVNNGNIFRVAWANDTYPKAADPAGCGAGCVHVNTTTDDTCVCSVSVTSAPLFTGITLPSAEVVRKTAVIGAPPVTSFDDGAYVLCATPECTEKPDPKLKVWLKAGTTDWRTETTIFETSYSLYAGDKVQTLVHVFPRLSLNVPSTAAILQEPHLHCRDCAATFNAVSESASLFAPFGRVPAARASVSGS